MDHHAELDCVRRSQAGDRSAFAVLVNRYWDCVRRWLHGLTRQAQLAEDLTQEAFVRAWTSLPELKVGATFRVWLFRIARNCLIDARRGPRGIAPETLHNSVADHRAGPVRDLLEREGQQQLEAALANLPEAYREAYLLWVQEELPYPDMAQVLGTTQETARWRVCKARQLLHQALAQYLDVKS